MILFSKNELLIDEENKIIEIEKGIDIRNNSTSKAKIASRFTKKC